MKLATSIKGKLHKINKTIKNESRSKDQNEDTNENSTTAPPRLNKTLSAPSIPKPPSHLSNVPSPLQQKIASDMEFPLPNNLTNDELDLDSVFTDDEYEEGSVDDYNDDSYLNLDGNPELRKVVTYPDSITHGVTFYKPLNKLEEEQLKLDQIKLDKYKELLDKASNSNTTILLELNLDGTIKYLSDHLFILHSKEHLVGQDISSFLAGSEQDKKVFHRTIDLLLRDDESYKIQFTLPARNTNVHGCAEGNISDEDLGLNELPNMYYQLEAQGILIHDVFTNQPSFTMWIIKPIFDVDELDELPDQLVEKLGFGATIFNNRLASLDGIHNLEDVPADRTEICRICETEVADWWLETHCRMCLYEHNLYDKIINGQEKLKETKLNLIEIKTKLGNHDASPVMTARDFEINVNDLNMPTLFPTLNLFITFCDDALNINNSELKMKLESSNLNDIEFQFSPTSHTNIQCVQDLKQRLVSLVYQIEEDFSDSQHFLKDLLQNTIDIADLKVTRLLRLKHTQQYHLRLKTEIFILTSEVIKQRIQSNLLNININNSYSDTGLNVGNNDIESFQSPRSISKDVIDTSLLNENFLNNDNRIPMLSKIKSKEMSITPADSNKEIFLSANESENNNICDDHIGNASQKVSNIRFNNSTDVFTSSTTNSTPTRKRSNSDLNGFSLSGSISPNMSGGDNLQSSEPISKGANPLNIPNISVATSILQRRSSVSSSRHANSNPKRSSPLVSKTNMSNLYVPSMSSIQKNPTTKSVFVKSPLTSPYMNALEPTSVSLTNLNNSSFSLNQSLSTGIPHPLELHKTSIGSVVTSGLHSSGSGPKVVTPTRSSSSAVSVSSRHSKPKIVDYEIVKPISKGAFGSVFLAKRKLTGDYVSIKCLKKSDMISKNQVTNVKNERAIMMAQTTKFYVANLYATFQSKDHLFLVMEYLIGGDLRTLIKMVGPLPSKWVKQYISEIIFGVADMHKDGIIHHDLKPDNFLLDRNGHVKFIDFGLSRIGLVNRQRKKESSQSSAASKNGSKNLHKYLYSSPHGSFSNLSSLHRANTDSPGRKGSDDFRFDISSSSGTSTPYSSFTGMGVNGIVEASFLKGDDSKLSFSLNQEENKNNGVVNFLNDINPNGSIPRASTPPKIVSQSSTSTEGSSDKTSKPTVDPNTKYVIFNPDETNKNFKFMGTPDYIAPEVIKGDSETPMCDWWSVGCIFFEFHFAYPPFHGDSPSEVFENILKGDIKWPEFEDEVEESLYITPEAKDLILKLLIVDPKQRLGYNSVDDIKLHPYFDDLDWETVYQEESEFVPNVTDPEDTDYFDNRGLSMTSEFQKDDSSSTEESEISANEDVLSEQTETFKPVPATIGSFLEPATSPISGSSKNDLKNKGSNNTMPSASDKTSSASRKPNSMKNDKAIDFGTFNFRNIHALAKSNKEVIERLKSEHSFSSNNDSNSTNSRHHTRNASLTGLFGANPAQSSSMTLVLSDQQKKSVSTPLASDGCDSEQASSVHSISQQSVLDNSDKGKLSVPPYSFEQSGTQEDKELLTKVNELDAKKLLGGANLLVQEEERLEAVSKLQLVRKSRKFSNISQSVTNSNSRRASISSNSTSGQVRHTMMESGLSSNSYLINSFNKNAMSFNLDILVCESIPIHSYLMTKNLEQFGCRVVNVSNGDELVRRATSDVKFDLIFSTFFSSKLNCVDIFKLIRNTNGANCNTPFIVITAYYQEALTMNVFDNVLEKPVSVAQMRSILSKYALKKAQECEETLLSDVDSDIFYDTKLDQ